MDGGEERNGILGVARVDTAPMRPLSEGVFDKMALAINIVIVLALQAAVPLRWNHRFPVSRFAFRKNRIRIIISVVSSQAPEPYDETSDVDGGEEAVRSA